ncbi:hypothetical protein PHISCL_00250 [Aspergillus sclerotialis]|uniref:Uncharacterized protein n=1 Tax=Aspergillus sclerotialis TaxID=2070753 RepID=A0A3A3A6P8_9EURO|nr:hypothetical protein PHISCL_00250 [Aspergillus sclerotialis]
MASPSPAHNPKLSESITITVHNLTANVFLNRPEEDLIPSQFLTKADQSSIVEKTIWAFRNDVEDARQVDLQKWSNIDIRYRGVFQTLAKVPKFKRGLYEDVMENLSASKLEESARFQGYVVYALLSDVLEMVGLRRWVWDEDGEGFFYLRPRLLSYHMDYLTGYRERYKDAPATAGFVSLDFHGVEGCSKAILPVSTVLHPSPSQYLQVLTKKQTANPEPLAESLAGKFKQMLSQLTQHIQHLRPPGDKFPDQEVFLIGLHGSRMHFLRGFFPGRKTSYLWCGRSDPATPDRQTSPSATSPRFYSKENIDRLMEDVLESFSSVSTVSASGSATFQIDPEVNNRTFNVVGTKEYNLWLAADFRAAVRMLVGLLMYLMSGKAKCGFLQKTFEQYPYSEETEAEVEAEMARRRQVALREQMEMIIKERRLEREQRKENRITRERFFDREARRSIIGDRISGFAEVGREGWNWVWEDKNMDPSENEEDKEDVILNTACMSGRPD